MLRIHFTIEDVFRSRIVAGLGPLVESAFALEAFGRGIGVAIRGWRGRVRNELGDRIFEVESISRRYGSAAELLNVLAPQSPVRDLADRVDNEARERMIVVLADFCQVAVMPYWNQIQNQLQAVRDAHGQCVATSGFERFLGAVHPHLDWSPPTLLVRQKPHQDVVLDGAGLLMSPSYFLRDQSCVFIRETRGTGMPAVVLPIGGSMKTQLRETGKADEQALGALIGYTRAAALEELIEGLTTGELADRLGISMAGASKHAAVLRRAGLITTARNRNTALHTLTPLGMALLRTRGLSAASDTYDQPRTRVSA